MGLAVEDKTRPVNATVDLHVDSASVVVGGSKTYLFIKRLMDIVLSIAAMAGLFIPMFVIGVLIKMDSKGPVIYRQERD